MRLFPACLLTICLLLCSTACTPAPKDPFAYAATPFSVSVEGTYLPASDEGGPPRPIAARVTAGEPVNGDPTLRDLTVTFTAPSSLRGATVTATLSPAPDGPHLNGTVTRSVLFSYPSDYGEVTFTAKETELDGLLRFAEALLPLGDVSEISPVAEDGSFTVTRKTGDGGREAVFVFAKGAIFPTEVTLADGRGRVELTVGEGSMEANCSLSG
jgi:hypothetical protein